MHSTEFIRLAQAADQNSWVIVAMVAIPADQGTYPSAWCVCRKDYPLNPDRPFLVSRGVLPTEDDREAFFCDSTYDVAHGRALKLMSEKAHRDTLLGAWS